MTQTYPASDRPTATPAPARRISAIMALGAVAVSAVIILMFLIHSGFHILLGLAGLGIAAAGAWWMVTERALRRLGGAVAVLVGLVVVALSFANSFAEPSTLLPRLVTTIALIALATACTRYALVPDLHALERERAPRPPSSPVLICNPKSGDGKVERFGLVAAARDMGVEVIVLGPDDDLEQLARDAVARGADCLGMAGGDGSQALVASVAVEHDLPFVCVSAGTRNHFALDLGLDRADPRDNLRAFRDAAERRLDYATVNGRLFVNNVSLGVYATMVQQESYRAGKAQTAVGMLPDLIGRTSKPFDLQFTTPTGEELDGAFLILVSNNPYATSASLEAVSRPELDSGLLGVVAVSATTAADAARLMTLSAVGLRRSSPSWHEFTTDSFEVRSRGGRAFAGIDGEAVDLITPLRFRCHPSGLRVLVPADNDAVNAARRARGVHLRALVDVAAGRTPRL